MDVYIYKLFDPSVLFANADLIKSVMFQKRTVSDGAQFSISPQSGWTYFAQHERIFNSNKYERLPKSADEVHEVIESFIQKANSNIADHRILKGLGLKALFPEKNYLKEYSTQPVISPETEQADHWLCRYKILLKTSPDNRDHRGNCIGAGLDFRIGESGEILAFHMRFCPIEKIFYSKFEVSLLALALSEAQSSGHGHGGEEGHEHSHETETEEHEEGHEHDDGEHGHEEEDQSSMVEAWEMTSEQYKKLNISYAMDGANVEQKYLAPVMPKSIGHHVGYIPVSKYSLAVIIIPSKRDGDVSVLNTVVFGGSGKYEYEWGAWNLLDRQAGIVKSGTGSDIELPLGVFCAEVYVTDKETGAVAHARQMVYGQQSTSNLVA